MDPTPPPPPPEGPTAGSSVSPSAGPLPTGPLPTVEWRLASPDGSQQFGPTVPAVFAQWIAEGRVQPDWLVWRSDWAEWKTAADAAADLPVPLLPQEAAPQQPVETTPAPIPTGASYTARRRRSQRQRRKLVIVLGVVTLALLGVLAWLVMG